MEIGVTPKTKKEKKEVAEQPGNIIDKKIQECMDKHFLPCSFCDRMAKVGANSLVVYPSELENEKKPINHLSCSLENNGKTQKLGYTPVRLTLAFLVGQKLLNSYDLIPKTLLMKGSTDKFKHIISNLEDQEEMREFLKYIQDAEPNLHVPKLVNRNYLRPYQLVRNYLEKKELGI